MLIPTDTKGERKRADNLGAGSHNFKSGNISGKNPTLCSVCECLLFCLGFENAAQFPRIPAFCDIS